MLEQLPGFDFSEILYSTPSGNFEESELLKNFGFSPIFRKYASKEVSPEKIIRQSGITELIEFFAEVFNAQNQLLLQRTGALI